MRDVQRRLAALEARRPARSHSAVIVQPWDLLPDEGQYDMVMRVQFVRPNGHYGGERMPYERTGIHPDLDDPSSFNARLHRQAAA